MLTRKGIPVVSRQDHQISVAEGRHGRPPRGRDLKGRTLPGTFFFRGPTPRPSRIVFPVKMPDHTDFPFVQQRDTKNGSNRILPIKKIIPHPLVYTGMETLRGIPDKYLSVACLVLTFLLFAAGGTAFNQNPFYGGLFFVIAMILFFAGVHFGRQDPDSE
jgi:hypothetical protein